MKFLVISNLSLTLIMSGIIWFVQLIHYPLFSKTNSNNFHSFHSEHTKRTTWLVAPLMIAEALICTILFIKMPTITTSIGLSILFLIWTCTFFVQLPIHNKLNKEFNTKLVHKLIKSNWIRTISWTVRAATCFVLI
ncbi:MAG: hypothetical protein CMH79_02375 [Nitrospinae bacterium]|nr:hypothetical protein [Nitrospinota bacterium]